MSTYNNEYTKLLLQYAEMYLKSVEVLTQHGRQLSNEDNDLLHAMIENYKCVLMRHYIFKQDDDNTFCDL